MFYNNVAHNLPPPPIMMIGAAYVCSGVWMHNQFAEIMLYNNKALVNVTELLTVNFIYRIFTI